MEDDSKKRDHNYQLTLYIFGREDEIRALIDITDPSEPLHISIQKATEEYRKTIYGESEWILKDFCN